MYYFNKAVKRVRSSIIFFINIPIGPFSHLLQPTLANIYIISVSEIQSSLDKSRDTIVTKLVIKANVTWTLIF